MAIGGQANRRELVVATAGAVLAVVLLLLPVRADAATAYTAEINGVEVWATQTVGTFVGEAHGDATGPWQGTVEHTPLTTTAVVTGGHYRMTLYVDGELWPVTGEFDHGQVEQIDPPSASGCRNQRFAVAAGGPGAELDVTLTHYRQSLFGQCFIYSASVSGEITLTVASTVAEDESGDSGGGLLDSIGAFFSRIGGFFT